MIMIKIDSDIVLILGLILVSFVTLLYILFDVNYYIVNSIIILWGKVYKKRIKVDQSTEYYGICTTNDLDIYFSHMNNARYLRNLDFARLHFYDRVGLFERIISDHGLILQKASNIRYRRPIPFLALYKIVTRIVYWDQKHIYLEHQFITSNDGFIRAVVLSIQRLKGINVIETMNELLGKNDDYRPEPPAELEDFMSLNEKSSNRLRKKEE